MSEIQISIFDFLRLSENLKEQSRKNYTPNKNHSTFKPECLSMLKETESYHIKPVLHSRFVVQ